MVMFHSHVKLQAGKRKHSNDNQMRKIRGVVGARQSASNLRPLPKGGFIQFHPHTQQSDILLDEATTALLLINALALLLSLGWFKGKSTGNHGFYHQIWGFPVNFPIIQFYVIGYSPFPYARVFRIPLFGFLCVPRGPRPPARSRRWVLMCSGESWNPGSGARVNLVI